MFPFTSKRRSVQNAAVRLPLAILVAVGTIVTSVSSTGSASGAVHAATVSGLSWTATPVKGVIHHLESVSCVSTSFCISVDDGGYAFKFDGATWRSMGRIDAAYAGLWSIDCASTAFCVAVDYEGGVLMYNGQKWSHRQVVDPNGTGGAVSCSSTKFCVVVNETKGTGLNGDVIVYRNSKWTAPLVVDRGNYRFDSISCPASNFCEAMTFTGYAYRFNGVTWSGPVLLDISMKNEKIGGVPSVSCVSRLFCAMTDGSGLASIFRGSTWTKASTNDPKYGSETSVSCVSNTFCASVDIGGSVLIFNGSSWSSPTKVATPHGYPNWSLTAISCVSSRFCMAVGLKYAYTGR